MWADADQSVEFSSRQRSNGQNGNKKAPASYPQRVSPHLLNRKATNERANTKRILFSYSGPTFSELDEDSNESCSEYEPDIEVKKKKHFGSNNNNVHYLLSHLSDLPMQFIQIFFIYFYLSCRKPMLDLQCH